MDSTQQSATGAASDPQAELIANALADPPLVLRCKVVLLGDSTVGKTSLATVFKNGVSSFSKNYNMTVGTELLVKVVHIPDTNVDVELYLADCGGFSGVSQDLPKVHWESANAVMLIYDVSNPDSFHNLSSWYDAVHEARSSEAAITGVVVANKLDLSDRGETVPAGMGQEFAHRLGFEFFEVCAMQAQDARWQVDSPFNFLAELFSQKYEERVAELSEQFR